jgi:hypothetical protein
MSHQVQIVSLYIVCVVTEHDKGDVVLGLALFIGLLLEPLGHLSHIFLVAAHEDVVDQDVYWLCV